MNLMPFADLIETAGLGVKGESLFLEMMPAEAGLAIMLRSPLSGTPINYEILGLFRTEFQLIVRGYSYVETKALMVAAIAAVTKTEVQVGEMFVKHARPRTEPVAFPLSKGNLLEFSVMFDAIFIKEA